MACTFAFSIPVFMFGMAIGVAIIWVSILIATKDM